jgi:hypothetical protein
MVTKLRRITRRRPELLRCPELGVYLVRAQGGEWRDFSNTVIGAIMSRKDFKLIAEVLKKNKASDELIQQMASALATTNPRFDRSRFFNAAKYEEEKKVG